MESIPLLTDKSTDVWRKSNILIVDDESSILEQLKQDLLFEDFSLMTASSAEAGMKILEHEEVHVVVCDQKMSGGISGTTFLSEVKKRWPHIVGIILSAFSEPEYLLNAMNKAKVFHYLVKPWDQEELIDCLTQALKLSHLNYLEKSQKREQELSYTRHMLTEAVRELDKTQSALEEATYALSTISRVSNKFYERVKEPLGDSLIKSQNIWNEIPNPLILD